MIEYNSRDLNQAYSIDLYANNPKERNVPERHIQILAMKYMIRRLIPAGVALRGFGYRFDAEPTEAVSSFSGGTASDLELEIKPVCWGDLLTDRLMLSSDGFGS